MRRSLLTVRRCSPENTFTASLQVFSGSLNIRYMIFVAVINLFYYILSVRGGAYTYLIFKLSFCFEIQ